ncbi:MAG: Mth938-like domain-containing protein [Alphaproteobacteria bacterium]
MEITPSVPLGRPVIEAYGGGRFRIAGRVHEGSVLILPDKAIAWPVASLEAVSRASLAEVFERAQMLDILLLGTGAQLAMVDLGLRAAFIEARIALEVMATGAACRTFNVLLAEDRRVGAALIAVP